MMWDERYDQEAFVYGEEPNSFLAQQWQQLGFSKQPGPVLCLAEGEGRNAVYLAEQGHAVTCVDLSAVGLNKARQLARRRGVSIQTVHADLATYTPQSNAFSAVVMIFAHTPPEVRQHSLAMARHALKPGGHLVLEGYTADQIGRGTGGPGSPELMFSLAELEQVFAEDDILLAREIERDVNEGQFHTGTGAVVQFVARKRARS